MLPNPANNLIQLESSIHMELVEVWQMDGKLVLNKRVNNEVTSVDVSQLHPGFFTVKVITQEGIWTSLLSVVK